MKNALEKYRQRMGFGFAEIARMVDCDRATVWKHCHADKVPQAAAARYHAKLKIPLEDLLPELFEDESQS